MNVPFVDLKANYLSIKDEIDVAIHEVVQTAQFAGGPAVERFESQFAKEVGAKHCVSCACGTDALFLALRSVGVGPGDEVIVPANTFIATAEAVELCGAVPVFFDVDKFFHLDADALFTSHKTKAVVAVHLYGQAADMLRLRAFCRNEGLYLIEDCAQSHLATQHDKATGTFGDAGCFSFYPSKNLGAFGDGGALVTNDDAIAMFARKFANHGSAVKYIHETEGFNSCLDAIQASVLSVKLQHLRQWNTLRFRAASIYMEDLRTTPGVELPLVRPLSKHVFHLFVIKTDYRDELRAHLTKCGVQTGLHYPKALPFSPVYRSRGYKPGQFPVAYSDQSRILSLPMYPEISDEAIHYVCDCIRAFYRS